MESGSKLISLLKALNVRVGAQQLVLVAIDAHKRFAVCSYGASRAACQSVRPLCDAIHAGLSSGALPHPNPVRPSPDIEERPPVAHGSVTGWSERVGDYDWEFIGGRRIPLVCRNEVEVARLMRDDSSIHVHADCGALVRIPVSLLRCLVDAAEDPPADEVQS